MDLSKVEQFDAVAVAELVAHLRDFGITTFAQVASLTEEGLIRRLGRLGVRVFNCLCFVENRGQPAELGNPWAERS